MNQQPEVVSWLLLERYALGELQGAERDHVERALKDDEQTRQCLARIHEDMRVMPALPALPPELSATPRRAWVRDWLNWPVLSWVAAAAAILLFVVIPNATQPGVKQHEDPAAIGEKGDHVALELVREHAGSIANDPLRFELGDRFKLRVSCPRSRSGVVDVIVQQDGEASFPIAQQAITCGNNVVLKGAFSFDRANAARVCVVLSNGARPTHQISPKELDSDHAACVALNPAR